jgi:hypothetical protein
LSECAEAVGGNRVAISKTIKQKRPYKNFIYSFEKI